MNWVFGELSFGELSVGELSLGELSFGDMSGYRRELTSHDGRLITLNTR